MSIFAAGLIVYYVVKMKTEDILLTYGMSLIMGGAVGNLIDRIRLGEVIDFLDVSLHLHLPLARLQRGRLGRLGGGGDPVLQTDQGAGLKTGYRFRWVQAKDPLSIK